MKTLIYNMDCLKGMKKIPSNTVDLVVTDPPYGISMMNKNWDEALPSLEIWKECLRVLKEGAFAFVMCIPRQDCLSKMILLLGEAGFKIDYSSIYWTYACLSEDTEILTKNGWEQLRISKKVLPNHPDSDIIIDVESLFTKKEILIYDTETGQYNWEIPERWQVYNISNSCFRVESDFTDQLITNRHRCYVEREGRILWDFAERLSPLEKFPILDNLWDLQEHNFSSYSDYEIFSSMLSRMSCNKIENEKRQTIRSTCSTNKANLSNLWKSILSSRKRFSTSCKQILFSQLQSKSNYLQSLSNRQAYSFYERKAEAKTKGKNDWRKKSCMERWGNIFQNAWQLFRSQVYSLSKRISIYVPERWLCYGTQAIGSTGIRSSIIKTRSSSSFRSRSSKQSDRKSHPFCIQQRSQTPRTRPSYQTTLATVKKVFYKGIVFCPTVSTGCFVARRNGKIFLTGNSGFPKAANVGKIVDRGMGMERDEKESNISISPQAQALDGSYVGLQLKPAVEIILTVQKPITTKYKRSDLYTLIDQDYWYTAKTIVTDKNKEQLEQKWDTEFDEGDVIERRIALNPDLEDEVIVNRETLPDSAEKTFPFMIVPKASKSEKNRGLEELPKKQMYKEDNSAESLEIFGTTDGGRQPRQNIHPTVKPVKLMSWLITLGSKEEELVLDPFMGSGSTGVAAQLLDRHFLGFELNKEYFEIAKLRLRNKDEQD